MLLRNAYVDDNTIEKNQRSDHHQPGRLPWVGRGGSNDQEVTGVRLQDANTILFLTWVPMRVLPL
jgi:hypothetical protein